MVPDSKTSIRPQCVQPNKVIIRKQLPNYSSRSTNLPPGSPKSASPRNAPRACPSSVANSLFGSQALRSTLKKRIHVSSISSALSKHSLVVKFSAETPLIPDMKIHSIRHGASTGPKAFDLNLFIAPASRIRSIIFHYLIVYGVRLRPQ